MAARSYTELLQQLGPHSVPAPQPCHLSVHHAQSCGVSLPCETHGSDFGGPGWPEDFLLCHIAMPQQAPPASHLAGPSPAHLGLQRAGVHQACLLSLPNSLSSPL